MQRAPQEVSISTAKNGLRQRIFRYAVIAFFAIAGLTSIWGAIPALVPINGGIQNANGSVVGNDFVTFYTAGHFALERDPIGLYDTRLFNAGAARAIGQEIPDLPFLYPPPALFLWAPFAWLSYLPALVLWCLILLTGLAWSCYRLSGHWSGAVIFLIAPPTMLGLASNQSGLLIAVFFGLALSALSCRPRVSGSLFGLIAVKPQFGLLLPFCLAAGRDWATFAMAAVSVGLLLFAGTLVFGLEAWPLFFSALEGHAANALRESNSLWERFPAVMVTVSRLAASETAGWAAQIVVATLAVAAAIYVWRTSRDLLARSLALASATLLSLPKVLDYDFALLLVPLAVAYGDFLRGRKILGFLPLAMMIWILPAFRALAAAIGWHPGGLLAAACLLYACYLVRRERLEASSIIVS